MRVLLHGATNASNFGDYIFAELFYTYLESNNVDTYFYEDPKYGISDYFKEKLRYSKRWEIKDIKNTDALVFISGGYFCEIPGPHSMVAEYKDVMRYMHIAKKFIHAKKPIYIMGVGAGPFTNEWFSRLAIKTLNYASVVTVRDVESLEYCKAANVINKVEVTADTALLTREYLSVYKKELQDGIEETKKILLLHIDSDKEVTTLIFERIKPAVVKFLGEHQEYALYLAADGVKRDAVYNEYLEQFAQYSPHVLKYDDPWVLCKQIERANIVITTKLHVGIVASSLGTSVISFPNIPNKTLRFYNQIGEKQRCIPLREANENIVYETLSTYAGVRIHVQDDIIDVARRNLELLPKA